MLSKKTVGLLTASLLLAGCNGGGGAGGTSDKGSSGFGGFYVSPSSSVGTTCMAYVMDSSKCSAIGGSWGSVPVAAKYTCNNPVNAITGKCHLNGLKFSAVTTPLNSEAIQKCEDLGGTISPTNQTDCQNSSGTWDMETPATTASSCNKAPADESECTAVGGSYGDFRSISGGLIPSIEGMDAGKVLVFLNNEDPTDLISSGTAITQVSGTVLINGTMGTLWQGAAAPVSRASDFKVQNDGKIYFHLNLGKDYSHDDDVNGISVQLQMYYRN